MGGGILEVNLVDAKGLTNTEWFAGKMDPYVVVEYRSQERKSSVARGQGSNPSWNETLKFLVQYTGDRGAQHKLKLRIMDKDTFSADDFVGETTIHVEDLIALGMENGKNEVHPTKYRVIGAERSYCGEIKVGLTFTAKVEDEEEEEIGGWKHSFHY